VLVQAMQDASDRAPDRAFEEHRPLLFHIAYRMLGTVSDAEDVVQEAWLRWQRGADEVLAPKSYLAQVVTRLAIDRLREVRRSREEYVGPWLPEPLVTTPGADAVAARAETLRMGLLVLLERLGPVERAVFVLREAFDYEYAEIARIVGKTEPACRQILARARRHLAVDQARFTDRADNERVAMQFMAAIGTGDMGQVERLLAEDAVFCSDGGGKVTAARKPIHGPSRIARFIEGALGKLPAGVQARPAWVNGAPGVLLFTGGALYAAVAVEAEGGQVQRVYSVSNPDKLARLG
jgi:RNA polymerase sigma-70 factor (ECF subfamily)